MINKPLLTVLSFSGGKQSSALLWMVILGILQKPDNFVVLNANPGMENSKTYEYIDKMENECKENGIDFYRVSGGNLYEDMVQLKDTNKIRFDTPAYFVKNKIDGSEGKLKQGCTQIYKIAPMDRKVREILDERFGISKKSTRLGTNIIETWIGFTYSEVERVKPAPQKYKYFRYPLIEMKMNNDNVINFFLENNLEIPPRSVCNACFANGLDYLKEMYYNRPDDWKQAVSVDESVRDWSQIGVRGDVFISNTYMPLNELAELDFDVSDKKKNKEKDYSCDSGYCFI